MDRKYKKPRSPEGASSVLVLFSEKNPLLLQVLNSEFTTVLTDPSKIEDVDVVYWVTENVQELPPLRSIKEMDWVPVYVQETFMTDSQIKLQETDWQIIRELEKTLAVDNPLRVQRDELRAQVDAEIS